MNVIRHKQTGLKVREGDRVFTPKGARAVVRTSYSGRQGARLWVTDEERAHGAVEVYAASETGCYVTSED